MIIYMLTQKRIIFMGSYSYTKNSRQEISAGRRRRGEKKEMSFLTDCPMQSAQS